MSAAITALREKIGRLAERLDQRIRAIVTVHNYSEVSADGNTDEVVGYHIGGTDSETPEYTRRVRRIYPYGLRGMPTKGTPAVVVHAFGGPSQGIAIAAESEDDGPSGLVAGEVALYCNTTGTKIKLTSTGAIEIDAASGTDITLNGGSLKVARDTDFVSIFTVAVTTAGGAIDSITFTPIGGGISTTLNAAAPGPVTLTSFGKINGGANNVKA